MKRTLLLVLVVACGGDDSTTSDGGSDATNPSDAGSDTISDSGIIPNPNAGQFHQVEAGLGFHAVSGTSASDVWACANNGLAYWDGGGWSPVTTLNSNGCVDIWAGAPSSPDAGDDLWVVGWVGLGSPYSGQRKGGVWKNPTPGDAGQLNFVNVEATDIDHVWISSSTYPGTAPSDIWTYDGQNLIKDSPQDGGNSAFGYGVRVFAANDVWAAADILAHKGNAGWTMVAGSGGALRMAVAGNSSSDLYIGSQGGIAYWDGQNLAPVTVTWGDDAGAPSGIFVEDATQSEGITFMAARLQSGTSALSGVVALKNGKGVATVVTTSTNSIPRKIWASSATDIWMTDLSAGQLYRGSAYLP